MLSTLARAPRWPQALSGITDEAGVRYASYTYDALGHVMRSEHVGGVDRVDFAYGFDAAGQPSSTVTDYAGPGGAAASRTYTFPEQQGVLRPTAVSALSMLLRLLVSVVVGVGSYLLTTWFVDQLARLVHKGSAAHTALEWLLFLLSPLGFGALVAIGLCIASFFALPKIWPKLG